MGSLNASRVNKRKMVETVIALRPKYGLKRLVEYLTIPRATFYYHLKRMETPDKYRALRANTYRIFEDSHETYGYRRIQLALENEGTHFAKETIRRIMREENLISTITGRKIIVVITPIMMRSVKQLIIFINRIFQRRPPVQSW